MENTSLRTFKRFFDFKGSVAPIAEKANRNYALKKRNNVNLQQRLHYFAVGHAFKNIDVENIFRAELDEETKGKKPTKFLALQLSNFTFIKELGCLLSNIRNINSHFIHDFELIKLDKIDDKIIEFLKQSFYLAVIQTCIKEKETTYIDFISTKDYEKQIVNFLLEKFYPFNDKRKKLTEEEEKRVKEYKSFRNDFKNKSIDEAIDSILFVKVNETVEWNLFETHNVFNITSGKYLSFEACLFLLTMFLYKGEANQLISKIKGFKRNDDDKYRSKRNLFSFFSKKFSSQDIDSEENHLVKFRDLIQYLNHYPTPWNKDLELESANPAMTNKLKEKIIEMEIYRSFPDFANDERFFVFAKYQIFGKKYLGENIEKEYMDNSFTAAEKIAYEYEIKISPEIKDANNKLKELKAKQGPYGKQKERNEKIIRELESMIKDGKNDPNPITEKLKTRIVKNLLYVSYGRNQDRFMDFATRFLAEEKYFGEDAEFKMYKFFSSEEQENNISTLKKELSKKQYDNLKFHQGKLVHFCTFDEHLKNYESWDDPFVIENNAVQVKVYLSNGINKIVSIQQNLMIYFLEDALYCNENVKELGKTLLTDYYLMHKEEFEHTKLFLQQNPTISREDKTVFKKILPKRLLHHYSPAMQNNLPEFSTFQLLFEKAKRLEERYNKLKNKAEDEGNLDDFLKRNKGRQFKLQFIRKACHLMYFKESYLRQVQEAGHHKRFHISKDEFNDFSKWMYAFDETPKYKDYLRELFSQKGFFDNPAYKKLFEDSVSLDTMYLQTKKNYEEWLKTFVPGQRATDKYSLNNYVKFFDNDLFFINISHFIHFLESRNKLQREENGNIIYHSLSNSEYLINEYYFKDKLEKSEYKTCGKLYNKLKTIKLEDSLLYEMSMHYLQIDKSIVKNARTSIINLLVQDVKFSIEDANKNHLYDLFIPFNKIDSFVELIKHKEEQEQDKRFGGNSFLSKLSSYIEKVRNNKDIKPIFDRFIKKNSLNFDDLNKINNHIITNSAKFTKVELSLEEYFIFKDKILIKKENRINIDEIKNLSKYFNKVDRHNAFHFNVPNECYDIFLNKIESTYVKDEVRPVAPKQYPDLTKQQRSVCSTFLDAIHNDFFNRSDREKMREEAENKYFQKIILNRMN